MISRQTCIGSGSPEIAFNFGNGPSDQAILFTEQVLRVQFPSVFKKFIAVGDRFRPKKYKSMYTDPYSKTNQEIAIGSVISFNPEYDGNIIMSIT